MTDINEMTKNWENYSDYLNFMIKDYSLTDPSRIALGLVRPKSKVLSAGCGGGREVRFLRSIGCRVLGIDVSDRVLLTSNFLSPYVNHLKADISEFRSKKKFDFVVCLHNTINYLAGVVARKSFINNSFDNLVSGGKLIIITKHRYSSLGTLKRSLTYKNDFYYSPSQINEWFADTSFSYEVVRISRTKDEGRCLLIIATKH